MDTTQTAVFVPQLPTMLEKEVLRRLEFPNRTQAIRALERDNPDFARAIRAWAAQAAQFSAVGTIDSDADRYSPESIGPYRVLQPIGMGAFGSVFLAQRGEGAKPVAVKVLTNQTRAGIETIKKEIDLLCELDHPTIVDVHEFGETGNRYPYYSMDFIPGRVLDSFFYHDLFSVQEFLAVIVQITDGLSYVHRKGVIHRDIKPANVVVDINDNAPRAHIVDFGLAALQAGPDARSPGQFQMVKAGRIFQQTLHTAEGAVVGTPAFMSPEQIVAPGGIDGRSDLYSLGVTLYVLLAAKYPVSPREIMQALGIGPQQAHQTVVGTQISPPTQAAHRLAKPERNQVKKHAARIVSQLGREQLRRVDDTILKCLEKDPNDRFNDAGELCERLEWAFAARSIAFVPFRHLGRAIRRVVRFFVKSSPEKRFDKDHRATVWFVTNRQPSLEDGGRAVFHSQESDSLTFGYSMVGIPSWRFLGRIRPRWWERLIGRDQYAVLHHSVITQSEFVDAMKGLTEPPGALLFIHGFNTTFDQAIIRCAQLQNDLKISGRVICYSWPSMGRPHGYGADAAIIEESEDCLVEVITAITRSAPYPFLHVLAHSMGNRALLRAISKIQDTGSLEFLAQAILAAPDVGQGLFKKLATAYSARTKRCTIYASKHDRALMGSRFIHARGRAGYIPPIILVDGIDTVDSSRIGFRLWGLNHSGFGETREILTDISSLIRQNSPPEHRIGLERQIDPETGKPFWVIVQ
ncbi:MAG: alpha/beta fold hydrolase [Planctomycetales bacterium]